jgi:hypothetical protein
MSRNTRWYGGQYPKRVYGAPLRVNRIPEVFTKPVCAGTEAVEVGALMVLVGGATVDVGGVVVAVEGRHWE